MSVQVQFSPSLPEESIREEAVKLAINRALEEERAKVGESDVVHSPDSKKKAGKRHKSLTGHHQPSPLVSSIASLAASGSPNTPSTSALHADSRDPVDRKASLPSPEQGYGYPIGLAINTAWCTSAQVSL